MGSQLTIVGDDGKMGSQLTIVGDDGKMRSQWVMKVT